MYIEPSEKRLDVLVLSSFKQIPPSCSWNGDTVKPRCNVALEIAVFQRYFESNYIEDYLHTDACEEEEEVSTLYYLGKRHIEGRYMVVSLYMKKMVCRSVIFENKICDEKESLDIDTVIMAIVNDLSQLFPTH
jgi:hypothetical protein